MSIDIRPIKIMFDTNIPGKQSVTFTKSLLYNPELKDTSGLDEYPYFTMDTTFPFSYLNSLSYEGRLKFFFNKSEMMKTFKIYKSSLFKDAVGTDVMPEILTKDEQHAKQVEEEQKNENKQKIISYTERIKKLLAEKKIIETSITQNEETYKDKKAKIDEENNKKIVEFQTIVLDLSEDTVKSKLDELFKPATKLEEIQSENNKKNTKYFNKKSRTELFNNEIKPYIEKIYKLITTDICDYFDIYIDKATDVKSNIKINYDKITGSIQDKIETSYEFISGVSNIIKPLIDELTDEFIRDKVTDHEKSKLTTLETEYNKKKNELGAKKKENENEEKTLSDNIAALKKGGANPVVTMDEEIQKIEKAKFQTKNGDENVLMMLRLLFPTKYPIMGNVFSSFNSVILKTSDFTLSFSDFLPSFLRTKLIEGTALYSYLKIDGKVYTVAQAVWLNDIYNHKEYADLIDKFKKLKIWKDKASRKLNDEINLKASKFNTNYGAGFDTSDINYIKSQKKDASEATLKLLASGLALEKLTLEYRTYNATVDDFINTVETFQTSVKANDLENISDNAKNMVDTYKLVTKYGSNFFKPKDKFNQIIENVNRDLEDIRINEYIRDRYMLKPGVDLDYEKDDQKYTSKLKSNFKEYTILSFNLLIICNSFIPFSNNIYSPCVNAQAFTYLY
jgi:hypothetical protein